MGVACTGMYYCGQTTPTDCGEPHASSAVRHLHRGGHDVSRRRQGTALLLTRLGHDVVFPSGQTCCGQMHVNTGYQPGALPLVANYADTFGDASIDAVVAPSGSCVGSVRHQHEIVAERYGTASLCGQVQTVKAKTYELSEFLVDVLGGHRCGRVLPAPGHLSPDLSLTADAEGRGQATSVAAQRPRHRSGRTPPRSRFLLWIRRHLRHQECGDFDGHAGGQDSPRCGHRRRILQRRRLVLPHAHRRRYVTTADGRQDYSPRGDSGVGGKPGARMSAVTLGLPSFPPRSPEGAGFLRGTEKFPPSQHITSWPTRNCDAISARRRTPSVPSAST